MNTTNSTRPAAAPAYYLGRSAMVWRTALRQRRHRVTAPSRRVRPIERRATTPDHPVAIHQGALS
jgi:hypothetical protein